ncbi:MULTISPECIES: hypothetical protein [unclassified Thiocapsa]|uniref:hypothetical protein n=1 Tax=unclassified Thiocapsa TaxID=2641286 RepID=UPI0035AEA302
MSADHPRVMKVLEDVDAWLAVRTTAEPTPEQIAAARRATARLHEMNAVDLLLVLRDTRELGRAPSEVNLEV